MDVGRRIGRYLWGRRPENETRGEELSPPMPGGVAEGESAEAEVPSVEVDAGLLDSVEIEEGMETMDDERMQILKMVEEHKITAEEGARLLAALETSGRPVSQVAGLPSRWFRVRVTDSTTGRVKVNVNVPLHIVTAVGKLGARFGLTREAEKQGIDLDDLFESIQHGAVGKLVDVTNEEGGEHVEVYVE